MTVNLVPSRRNVRERWERAGWNVRHETRQRLGGDGNPLFDEHGNPVTVELTVLELVFVNPDGSQHVLELPLDDDTRRALAAALNGGVIVPLAGNGHHLPG